MLPNVLLGSGFAFAAVIQPGPLQAFLLSRAVAAGWRRTLPAALFEDTCGNLVHLVQPPA